jgi:guanylate kinase
MSSERAPRRGLALVVSSPSGAGKTTLCRQLVQDHQRLSLSVSVTTRPPRPGEEDGREYHFTSDQAFDDLVAKDAFLEWAQVHGARYGSLQAAFADTAERGHDVLFDIDWQGARSIAAKAPLDTVRVFILPPTMTELRRRLYTRAQDHADVIERRLKQAKVEIERWSDYDYLIVNDDFDLAYAELTHIYHAERSRRGRNLWLGGYVDGLLGEEI